LPFFLAQKVKEKFSFLPATNDIQVSFIRNGI